MSTGHTKSVCFLNVGKKFVFISFQQTLFLFTEIKEIFIHKKIFFYRWHAGDWGPCSVSCGGGSKLRQVHCVEETNNTKIMVRFYYIISVIIKLCYYISMELILKLFNKGNKIHLSEAQIYSACYDQLFISLSVGSY